jgi:DNA-binding NarL/FixJ family response regulator
MDRDSTADRTEARIVVADDHEAIREAVRVVLTSEDVVIVGEAGDGLEAVALADELAPDVVVLDLCMPVLDGLEAIAQIRSRHPRTQVVVLSIHEDPDSIRRSVEAGATEHVVKGTGAGALRAAVSRAAAIALGRTEIEEIEPD